MMTFPWAAGLDFSDGPKYQVLRDAILSAITSGALKQGEKLPPVRDLAWKVGVTPGTVARAYTMLTDEGRLEAAVGRGTFVAPPKRPVQDDIWARQTEPLTPDGIAFFSPKLPDVGQISALQAAFSKVAHDDPVALLEYPSRLRYKPIREAAVHWLKESPTGPLSESDLVLTHGGQSGISLVLQTVAKGPRPVIMVEELSYAGFRRAAEMLRIEIAPVPIDDRGVIPEELDRVARETGAQLLCTSPEVHNPTTVFTPLERRIQIAEVARKRDFQILEDDCYRVGHAMAPSYRALAPDRGWYVTSISKLLTPSMRVGFAVAPEGQGPKLRRAAEYGFFGLAWPVAEAAQMLLTDPRTRQMVETVRQSYDAYLKIMINKLGAFDLWWQQDVPFVWLMMPQGWRASSFCRAAEARGIRIRSAEEFTLREDTTPQAVRIAVNAQLPRPVLEGAMDTLADLLSQAPEDMLV